MSVEATLVTAGVACVIAAIVGGGLKAFGIELPVLQSPVRQGILAAAGVGLLLLGRTWTSVPTTPASSPTAPVLPTAADPLTRAAGEPNLAPAPAGTASAGSTRGAAATPITVDGPPVAVTTNAPGQRARLAFEGRAGQVVSVTHRDAAGLSGPSARAGCVGESTVLLRPDGQQLAGTVSCGLIEATRLPVDGIYIIEVAMLDASTADLTLSLHAVPP